MTSPEASARRHIDAALTGAGWLIQDRDAMNLHAGRGVAVREFKLAEGHGFVDYTLSGEQEVATLSFPLPWSQQCSRTR
jgi:type I restriction enzyme R subunit